MNEMIENGIIHITEMTKYSGKEYTATHITGLTYFLSCSGRHHT